jgi:hypothetical protein
MFYQEITSVIDQIYSIIGVTRSDTLDLMILPMVLILLLIIIQDTLGTIFKGLFGGYER